MRLKVAIWIGCLILSNIAITSAQDSEGETEAPSDTIPNGDVTSGNGDGTATAGDNNITNGDGTTTIEDSGTTNGDGTSVNADSTGTNAENTNTNVESTDTNADNTDTNADSTDTNAESTDTNGDTNDTNNDGADTNENDTNQNEEEETPLDAPAGSRKTFVIQSAVQGMTMALDFEQQANNTLKMHCRITTDTSATSTLEKFCMATEKPALYMVNRADCSGLGSLESFDARRVAHTISPSKIISCMHSDLINLYWSCSLNHL